MAAVNRTLYIEQGATFVMTFQWVAESLTQPGQPGEPYNLTGCTARMQIRRTISSPVLLEASTENGKITIDPLIGQIQVKLDDLDTDKLNTRSGRYDLEVQFNNEDTDVYRLLEGKVVVSLNVTR